jgi:predicted dehydrogenase
MNLSVIPAAYRPRTTRPIVIIGAGGIVRDAHLPAYRKAGFEVAGIYDIAAAKATSLAREFALRRTFTTLSEAIESAPAHCIFDVAVPAAALLDLIRQLPDGAAVLMQKPMGQNLQEARAIRDLCHSKHLSAAVNFQLRFAPATLAARDIIHRRLIGELHDLEVRVNVYTPWSLWTFLEDAPRVEILYHSIHYIDLIRSFFGDPQRIYAKTLKHPSMPKLASTRSNIILDYGDMLRATITANHGHEFGPRHQESYIKWEGTRGAIKTRLGLLLDYPKGQPDEFEYITVEPAKHPEWQRVEIEGSWFPDAFIGSMASLMSFLDGAIDCLPTSVDDALKTMGSVEAAYESSATGGTMVLQTSNATLPNCRKMEE